MSTQTEQGLKTVDEVMEEIRQVYGFVPKVMEELAHSPAALCAYWNGMKEVEARSSLAPQEREIARLTFSALNECHYCTKAHSFVSTAMMGIAKEEVERVQAGQLPSDAGLARIVGAARKIYEKKGWLDAADLGELEANGIDRAKTYDLITLLGLKVMSNYVNHIAKTPLDAEIAA